MHGIGQVYVPQDMNYPALRLDVDRVHAGELGLSQKDVVDNVITALNSNYMIAPNYWVDRKSGNDYYLTVQFFEKGQAAIHNMADLGQIPLRDPSARADLNCGPSGHPSLGAGQPGWACGGEGGATTVLNNVVSVKQVQTPTEVDHYQIQRVVDIYVTPAGEDLGRVTGAIRDILAKEKIPGNVRVNLRGMVQGMEASFKSFAFGFLISFVLLFLILTAQFKSFIDPLLIMLAIPMGFVGVLIILPLTGSTLNVMSLMGVLMLVGIADSNSILIVDFAHNLERQGLSPEDAVITACRVRLRPILMTSLATIIGMIPMALKMGTGAEQYAPMAKAIIGGLDVFGVTHDFHRAGGLSAGVWKKGSAESAGARGGDAKMKQEQKKIGICALLLGLTLSGWAQETSRVASSNLPSAPVPQMGSAASDATARQAAARATAQGSPGVPAMLSVKDAEALALKNNPQISVARLNALASQQVTREARSEFMADGQHRCDCSGCESRGRASRLGR